MKYTQIPATTFEQIQMNAGIAVEEFNPASGEITGLLGATTGGFNFTTSPEFSDLGEDIDNCPKNTKELKHLDNIDVKATGTFVTVTPALAKRLATAADVSGNKITPRRDLSSADFDDIWIVGDYSDKNGDTNGGFVAIHLMNALSTGGFQWQTTDKAKGQFAFEFTGHFSISAQDVVPYEIYVKAGTAEPT